MAIAMLNDRPIGAVNYATKDWIDASANANGVISDACLVHISDPFGEWNKPVRVHRSATVSMPTDCQYGVRTVQYYSQNNVTVTIHGVDDNGKAGVWINTYNSGDWQGWRKLLNVISFDADTGTLYTE